MAFRPTSNNVPAPGEWSQIAREMLGPLFSDQKPSWSMQQPAIPQSRKPVSAGVALPGSVVPRNAPPPYVAPRAAARQPAAAPKPAAASMPLVGSRLNNVLGAYTNTRFGKKGGF